MDQTEYDREGAVHKPIDNNALSRLCQLLMREADKVLNGQASFTLTTDVLSRLTHDCRRHSFKQREGDSDSGEGSGWFRRAKSFGFRRKKEDSNDEEEWKANIQFVKDFMLSTPSLKIIHNYGTIRYPINLQRFGNVTTLELRKIPIHLVEGLQALRGRLTSLIANRCPSNAKDLLETCGGDRSAPLSWQQLKCLSLVFNDISHLDDSFRLLPYVEYIDLSHNRIEKCDNILEYLSDVLSINLSYNILVSIPVFSVNTRNSLTVLNLRGNNLDSIQGVEEANSLQSLDLGENYMVKHSVLAPLRSLPCLKQLQLDGNPLYYHKQHRTNTISYLAFRVISNQFSLDGKRLSRSEILAYRPQKLKGSKAFHDIYPPQPVNAPLSVNADPGAMSSSSGLGPSNPSSPQSSTPRKKGKRKKIKARDTEIRDTSYDYSSGLDYTPAGSPSMKFLEEQMDAKRQEALKTKREIELLKEQYGPDYLQAIEDRKLFSQVPPSEVTTDSDGIRSTSKSKKNKKNLFCAQKKSKKDLNDDVTDVVEPSIIASEEVATKNADCSAINDSSKEESVDGQNLPAVSENNFVEASGKSESTSGGRTVSVYEECDIVENAPVTNPIMAAIERIASGQSSDESGAERNSVLKALDFDIFTSNVDRPLSGGITTGDTADTLKPSIDDKRELNQTESLTDKGRIMKADLDQSDSPSLQTILHLKQVDNVDTTVKKVSTWSQSLVAQDPPLPEKCSPSLSPRNNANISQSSSSILSPNRSNSEIDTSTDNSLQLSEGEQESEAVFVTLPDEQNKMIIVTFTDLFLVEKDVRDKVTEKLDLRSLTSLETKRLRKHSSSDDIGKVEGWKSHKLADGSLVDVSMKEDVALKLKFDYIRKDRQRRCYLVEAHDAKKMLNHLQPFLSSKAEKEKAKLSVVMQCLKCSKTFSKKELAQKSKQLPRSGSSKDFHSMKQITDNPTLICPACGSSIVIEIETTDSSKASENSNPVTPVGSYNSSTGFLNTPPKPQKPAPLLRNRSFDNQSLQAKLAAKLVARKNSVSSLDCEKMHRRTGSGSGSVNSLGAYGSSPQSETRERSNAFNAVSIRPTSQRIQSPFIGSTENIPLESEELICIEDHFTEENMKEDFTTSQQLAIITTRLRDDSKGNESSPSSKSFMQSDGQSKRERNQMEDSGFESGVYLSGSSNVVASQDLKEDARGSGGIERRGKASAGDSNQCINIPERCTPLELRANSLVQEGEYLERQEWAVSEQTGVPTAESRRRDNSISISDLKKLISTNTLPQKDLVETDGLEVEPVPSSLLHNSGSGSSIAILANNEDNVSLTATQDGSQRSTPVHFVVGSLEKSADHQHLLGECPSADLTRVSSPLNSDICSSMVSSIYETSVSGEKEEDPLAGGNGEKAVVILGSSDSAKSVVTDEDMPSIYDRPSGSVKSKRKKKKGKKCPSTSIDAAPVSETSISQDNQGGGNSQRTHSSDAPNAARLSESYSRSRVLSPSDDSEIGAMSQISRSPGMYDDNESKESDFDNEILGEEPVYRFDHLNHRLTLYLMMSLFSNDEVFKCKMQADITQYIIKEQYSGILIMSSRRFYVLKITSDDHSREPDEWLSCVEVQPIPELRYIDVGLGGQSLRIEFVTDCSSYTLVTRDKQKTMQFVDVLHNNLAHYAVSEGITTKVVVNEDVDQATMDNLDSDVVSKGKSEQKLLYYCMGFIERGNQKLFPVSFVVSTDAICLVRANHQWPQPRLQGPITIETVGKQFTVLERQKINNVASVELCEASLRRLKLELFNETEGVSTDWNITLTNRDNAVSLIHALSDPWAKEFGVEMEVTYSELHF